MATGNNSDPCRSWSPNKKKINDVNSEQDKEEEAEDLYQNYASYRNQNEMEENTDIEVPTVPTTTDQLLSSPSSAVEIGRQLAIIGDELNHQRSREFQGMRAYLLLPPEHGNDIFYRVAERLYDNGINWGQIIALLSFGYKMMTYVCQRGIMECFGKITKSVTKLIAKNQIAEWTVEQRGWTAALSIKNANLKWLLGLLVAVMLGMAIAHKIYECE